MNRVNKVRAGIVLVGMLSTFTVLASSVNLEQATTGPSINERYQDLVKQCQYNPDECTFNALGAGNGGGNEPPYTPRKPKKKAKKPTAEI